MKQKIGANFAMFIESFFLIKPIMNVAKVKWSETPVSADLSKIRSDIALHDLS